MKRNQLTFAIFALLITTLFAGNARAQFGDLINKVQKKVEKTTKQVNAPATQSGGASNAGNLNVSRTAKLGQPGTVGLSKSPIDPNNWQAAKYETSFTMNDNIYAIAFFDKPISKLDLFRDAPEMPIAFDIGSGVLEDYWDVPLKPEQKDATVIAFPINHAPADVFNQSDAMAAGRFLYMAKKYNNQKGTVKLMVSSLSSSNPMQIVIALDFTNAEQIADARFQAINNAVNANSDKANASNPLPKAGMTNPALASQFTALINGADHDWKLLKLIIASPEWQIERHEISGVILNRYLVTRNVIKDPTGVCRIQSIVFQQNYNGSGYGKTFMDVRMGRSDDYAVSCDKAK